MGLRSRVKQVLRMCGHAFAGTVRERLEVLESQVLEVKQQQRAQVSSSAEIRNAVLQVAETQAALLQSGIHTAEKLLELTNHAVVDTRNYKFNNPEAGLMEFLFSYLPARKAVDIGAHIGDMSECLLRAGYEVYAFEPNPPVYDRLVVRLGDCGRFHPFRWAIARDEGEMPLHLAEDLSGYKKYEDPTLLSSLDPHTMFDDLRFTGTTQVPVTNLASLHRLGIIPEDVSLIKIDTEGFDLEVIRGMGDHRYPVVAAEFWDKAMPFGRTSLYTLDNLVTEMRNRDYPWHIVMYRLFTSDQVTWYSNFSSTVPTSWGNVFFFRDFNVFSQAQAWCSAVLPRTYFKPRS